MGLLSLFTWSACATQQEKPVDLEEKEESFCLDGSYTGFFYVWSERPEERRYTEEEPLCQNNTDIHIEGELIYASFLCSFQRGQQERVLAYELSGVRNEESYYTGDVWFTRNNGEVVQSTFEGSCMRGEPDYFLLYWYLDFMSPGGQRLHNAKLTSEALF